MKRVGKSRRAPIVVVFAATLGLVALGPAFAPAAVDEYSLNLPDGGDEAAAPAAPAPVAPAAPVAPLATAAPELAAPVVSEPKPKPKPVYLATSVSAAAGAQAIPTLDFGDSEGGLPLLGVGAAGLAFGACLFALWRLRLLREQPAAARVSKRRRGATA